MKCIEVCATVEQAREKMRLLKEQGIDAKLIVDPLESVAPALSPMIGVGLMVPDALEVEALNVLHGVHTIAS